MIPFWVQTESPYFQLTGPEEHFSRWSKCAARSSGTEQESRGRRSGPQRISRKYDVASFGGQWGVDAGAKQFAVSRSQNESEWLLSGKGATGEHFSRRRSESGWRGLRWRRKHTRRGEQAIENSGRGNCAACPNVGRLGRVVGPETQEALRRAAAEMPSLVAPASELRKAAAHQPSPVTSSHVPASAANQEIFCETVFAGTSMRASCATVFPLSSYQSNQATVTGGEPRGMNSMTPAPRTCNLARSSASGSQLVPSIVVRRPRTAGRPAKGPGDQAIRTDRFAPESDSRRPTESDSPYFCLAAVRTFRLISEASAETQQLSRA